MSGPLRHGRDQSPEHAVPTLISDSDAVMKNPFHTPEMPINSALFESRLQGVIAGVNGP